MELRVTITVSEHGYSEETAERTLDAFLQRYPEAGPVVSQNISTGELSVTFALEAEDALEAATLAARIFAEGTAAARLEPTQIVGLSVSAVETHEPEREVELQPA